MVLKTRHGVLIAAVTVGLSSGLALAQERGLIWAPAKNSDTSYSARIGAKLPTETPIRGGLEMGMNASDGGALVDTPVKFWGTVTLLSSTLPGAKVAGDIGVLMNALTGSSALTMTTSQKRIATADLDVESNRNMTVRYDGTAQQWSGLDVSQSLRLTRSETGTAFVLTGASRDSFNDFTSSVGLEQKLGENLTVSGHLDQGYQEDRFRPSINARYNIRW
ncbi:hypothetical protein RRU01S_14_00670 [Agrobacterium rubi TR3 = NBRC 13261]|uniref:Autotransporter domain-containing protein n=1 Tax=Agrobacterium rubi TR3 = NBRC 13261 TaxID=1368415 RepID=A0A081CW00_9HYPH|nr:hypothetical protein [Agrobacterium rubi]MBP1877809.1 hypothetical protein [Agrobacterium rubi]MCL6652002.1 hypothetical protein [Agrobacterium rubi]GAK70846.1 hypothetical protein RRU01S_14_00670 [Agrobacterium rubi TR3 = NBRC 13261]